MRMPKRLTAVCATAMLSMSAYAAPIDLGTWTQEGAASAGNWTVSADGSTVNQSRNGDPTFFVSDTNYLDTEFDGSFRVSGGDNDMIGFVFGYQSPLNSNSDPVGLFDTFLFDWKQAEQSTAPEGFSLSYLNGSIAANDSGQGAFWGKDNITNPDPDFQVIETDFGADRGWERNVAYDFNLLYQTDRIRINIDGGIFNNETIFDITPADVAGLDAFQDGRFGFYNLSQSGVEYAGFTETVAPPTDPCVVNPSAPGCMMPPPPPTPVPEPGTIGLVVMSGLLAFLGRRRIKR